MHQIQRNTQSKQFKEAWALRSYKSSGKLIVFEDSNGLNYVIVRSARYPESSASTPHNIDAIKQDFSELSTSGYVASVGFANEDDHFAPDAKGNGNFLPIYRGHGVLHKYSELRAL